MKHVSVVTMKTIILLFLSIVVFAPVKGQILEEKEFSLPTISLFQNLSTPIHLQTDPEIESTGTGEPSQGTISPDAQWDLQFEYSVSDSLGYLANTGAFWTGTEFWISKWNSDTLATLDTFGSVIQIFTIPGISGVRSITSDGTNVYLGTANDRIYEVNPITKTVLNTIFLSGAANQIGSRFVTFDPSLDSGNGGFYIGNFTSDIAAISMTGSTLNVIPQSTHGRLQMYGAAYDNISPGGPYLWIFEQLNNNSDAIISQLQLPAGTYTGVSFDVAADLGLTASSAGGLFIATDLVPGQNTIGGIVQGPTNKLVGYQLDFLLTQIDAEISNALPDPAISILPESQILPFAFSCDVRNLGLQTIDSAKVEVEVLDLETNAIIYSAVSPADTILPTITETVSFGTWTPPDTGDYTITMIVSTGTQLDEDSGNDTSSFAFSVSDTVYARDTGIPVSSFGVGTGQTGALATKMSLVVQDTLTSVTAAFGTPPVAMQMFFSIFAEDPATGGPQPFPIASTSSYTFTSNDNNNGVTLTLPVNNGGIVLPPGNFFIAANETFANMGILVSDGFYTAGNLWFRANNIGGGTWQVANNEVVMILRGNFGKPNIPQEVSFETSFLVLPEDTGSLQVFVDITGLSSQSTEVMVSASAETATSTADFQFTPVTISFPANTQDSIAIPLTIVDDLLEEATESFLLLLSSPTNGAILTPYDTLYINIVDDDTLPKVEFISTSEVVFEGGGTYSFSVGITDPKVTPTTVSIGTSGTADSLDYLISPTILTFSGGSSVSQEFTVTVIDDTLIESMEEILLSLENPSMGTLIGAAGTMTIEIIDNELPVYTIAALTNDSNGDGFADSLTVSSEIRGIVYGGNLSTSGLQFTLIDSTGGIQVFSFNVVDNYVASEGDSLHVWGTVSQFNGLTQFEPDSIQLISQANPLKPASLQILPGEKDESRLIVINCVTLVDVSAWPLDGDNANLEVRNGVDTFIVRIDKETNLDGSPAPTGWFNITGIGGQFDSSPPYMSGYQLLPRYVEDIESLPNPFGEFEIATDQLDESVGTYSFDFSFENGIPETLKVSLKIGAASTATDVTDFTLDPFSEDFVGCGDSTSYSGTLIIVDDTDIEGDETVEIILEASNAGTIVITDTLTITITETDNLFEASSDLGISIYPNPGTTEVVIEAEERILSIELLDMTGRVLTGKLPNAIEESIETESLPSGVYSLRVETSQGIGTYRWVKR